MGKETREEKSTVKMVPGPGTYTQKTSIGEGPKIGLSPRIEDIKKHMIVPGPGAYTPNSGIVLEGAPSAGMGYGTRADDSQQKKKAYVPGPGTYASAENKKDGPKFGFGTSERAGIVKTSTINNPGPGNYNVGSTVAVVPLYEKSKMK